MEIGFEVDQHVRCGGSDGARSRKGIQIPCMCRAMVSGVTREKARLLLSRKRNRRIMHSQRIEHFILEKLRIRFFRADRERLTQQAKTIIAVKESRFVRSLYTV